MNAVASSVYYHIYWGMMFIYFKSLYIATENKNHDAKIFVFVLCEH